MSLTTNNNHYPTGAEPDDEAFLATLRDLGEALAECPLRVLVMGGVGSASLARPRPTDDIDLFVHPEDAEALLEHLEHHGFDVERTNPTWLFKAFRRGVLVDVIFRSTGDIYIDDAMLEHAEWRTFKGVTLRTVSPEDLVVIKAVAATEHATHHWHDALGVIARCDLDWSYLVDRSRRFGPRRILSLLLYAESIDLAVPSPAIDRLFQVVHPQVVQPSVGHDAEPAGAGCEAHDAQPG